MSPRLHPCLLLTPALHSMGKNNTSFGLCATDTFSLARTNVQLAKLATDILDDAQKKEHSFGLALNFNQRCWKNRVLVVSQSGNHSVLFFSFLSPFEWPASHRERERERERERWMDWEVKLTMAGGCSNLTLFATKFCNPMDFVNIEIWVLFSNAWMWRNLTSDYYLFSSETKSRWTKEKYSCSFQIIFSLPSWFIADFRQWWTAHCCLMDPKP